MSGGASLASFGPLGAQINLMSQIPSQVLANWPAWLGFAGVNMVLNMALAAVPNTGGTGGRLINSALGGMAQVTQHVAWDTLKGLKT